MELIGGSPTWTKAPFKEAWVHGNQLDRFKGRKVDKIFEIHDDLSEHPPEYPQWLVDHGIPMIVGDKFPIKADHVKVFPRESNVLGMLTSTPVYMMALAIHEAHKEINIYGVEMGVDNHEYFKQRPAMYAWIGYARGLGIKVNICEESSLFKDSYDEGRDWGKPKGPFSEEAFLSLAEAHRKKIEEYTMLVHTHSGSLQTYERLAKMARAVDSGQNINLTNSLVIK